MSVSPGRRAPSAHAAALSIPAVSPGTHSGPDSPGSLHLPSRYYNNGPDVLSACDVPGTTP